MPHTDNHATVPLVVDIDGTLVQGDLLVEGVARLLVTTPFTLFTIPFWLAKGRAVLKRRVAEAMPLPPETLVLNPAVVAEITAATEAGREVWLASAADASVVAPLAETIQATGYLASDGRVNLAGAAKAAAVVERFGERGFDYIGDERRDLAVWRRARHAIGVNLSAALKRTVRRLDADARFLAGVGGTPLDYLRALRPQQWIKNILVFAPLVAHHDTSVEPYLLVAAIFVSLSACASGGYVMNDWLDLPHDRRHASKRLRPMAAGTVSLLPMIGIGAALMVGGVALAWWLSPAAGRWILLYVVVALAYSLWIKRMLFADIVTLALLYTLRVLAGAAVVAISPSYWFLAFSIFIFLALAIVKRQGELHALNAQDTPLTLHGRSYRAADRAVLAALNAASMFAAVVVLMFYINSAEVASRYTHPQFLWLMCPVLLYWLGRITLLVNRGELGDDPVAFTVRDRASYVSGIATLAALAAAL